MAGIAPFRFVPIEVALRRFAESKLASSGEPGIGSVSMFLIERVDAIGEQSSRRQRTLTRRLQTELGRRTQAHHPFVAVALVTEHVAFRAAVADLKVQPADESAAI